MRFVTIIPISFFLFLGLLLIVFVAFGLKWLTILVGLLLMLMAARW